MLIQLVLVVTAIAAVGALAASRVVRVRMGLDPQLDTLRHFAVIAAAAFVPPLVIQALLAPSAGPKPIDGFGAILFYLATLAILVIGMRLAARFVTRWAPPEQRQLILLALAGREELRYVPFDPPMSPALREHLELVDARNAEFPRGAAFMDQAALPEFRASWEALDGATRGLEAMIAEAGRLGTGVAQRAIETAIDARSRLEALRRDAEARGQYVAV